MKKEHTYCNKYFETLLNHLSARGVRITDEMWDCIDKTRREIAWYDKKLNSYPTEAEVCEALGERLRAKVVYRENVKGFFIQEEDGYIRQVLYYFYGDIRCYFPLTHKIMFIISRFYEGVLEKNKGYTPEELGL